MSVVTTTVYSAPRSAPKGYENVAARIANPVGYELAVNRAKAAEIGRARAAVVAQRREKLTEAGKAVIAKLPADIQLYMKDSGYVPDRPDMRTWSKASTLAEKGILQRLTPKQIEKKVQSKEIQSVLKQIGWKKAFSAPAGSGLKDVWTYSENGKVVDYSEGYPGFVDKEFKQSLRNVMIEDAAAKMEAQQQAEIAKAAAEAEAKRQADIVRQRVWSRNYYGGRDYGLPGLPVAVSSMNVGVSGFETLGRLDEQGPNDPVIAKSVEQTLLVPPRPRTNWLKTLFPLAGAGLALWLIMKSKKRRK